MDIKKKYFYYFLFLQQTICAETVKKEPVISKNLVLTNESENALKDVFDESNDKADHCFFLAGILFSHKKAWSLWINDKNYTQQLNFPTFKILKVESNRILVKSLLLNKSEPKWLSFNQTYCADTHEILHGDQRLKDAESRPD